MKKIIEVDNLSNFEFWLGMFKLRSKVWQRSTLKKLKASISPFETCQENSDKIKALEFILN